MGHGCCIVQSLIGMAIAEELNDQTLTLIAAENSPNVYWALTELAPGQSIPSGDVVRNLQIWEFSVPEVRDLDRQAFSLEQIKAVADKIWDLRKFLGRVDDATKNSGETDRLLLAVKTAPEANAYLLKIGYKPAELKAFPELQIVLIFRWKQYLELRDDYFKWGLLPDSEAFNRWGQIAAK